MANDEVLCALQFEMSNSTSTKFKYVSLGTKRFIKNIFPLQIAIFSAPCTKPVLCIQLLLHKFFFRVIQRSLIYTGPGPNGDSTNPTELQFPKTAKKYQEKMIFQLSEKTA